MFPDPPGTVIGLLRKELSDDGRTTAHTRAMLEHSLTGAGFVDEVKKLAALHSALYDESGFPTNSAGEERNADCVKETEALAALLERIGV